MWHRRLAHANPIVLQKLLGSAPTSTSTFSNGHDMCDVCIQAKHKDRPLRITVKRTTQPFELIHSDVCGPFKHPTLGVYRYYIIFVCDCTRWTEIFLLPGTKSELCSSAFVTFEESIKARNFKVLRFRCDNGKGEYNNNLFRGMLASRGITYEPCPPYAHHKNGVAERMIQTINEKARAMILDSQVPIEHWGWAVHTAVYLHQRTPNESLQREQRLYTTPYEMLHSHGKPTHTADQIPISYAAPLHHLRRFGCWVSRQIPEPRRTDSKFGSRSKPCMMVGYVHDSTTVWKIWDPEEGKVKTQSSNIRRRTECLHLVSTSVRD